MKKIATTLVLLAFCASSAMAANSVRISQVYGGGGATSGTPTYIRDYIELFNNSNVAVNIGGWALEYGSATGNWGSSAGNIFVFPANTLIQPCSYLLVEAGAPGTVGAPLPITADFSTITTGFSMSATNGKVGLFSATNSNLACGSELPGTIVDKVAYGTANCAEGTAMSGLSNQQGGVRVGDGTQDSDNNSADFTVVLNPIPHNAASPQNPGCLATPTGTSTWGKIKTLYR